MKRYLLATILAGSTLMLLLFSSLSFGLGSGRAAATGLTINPAVVAKTTTSYKCGGGSQAVSVSIDFGCKGVGNPITDALFAIIRILSDGVGLVVIASIVVGGIQYTSSRGDPQATALAINRIRSSLIALLIYIFGYAILNYIIPAGFLH